MENSQYFASDLDLGRSSALGSIQIKCTSTQGSETVETNGVFITLWTRANRSYYEGAKSAISQVKINCKTKIIAGKKFITYSKTKGRGTIVGSLMTSEQNLQFDATVPESVVKASLRP